MLKKIFCMMIVIAISIMSIPSLASTTANIKINLNGNPITFNSKPRLVNGRILVPVATIAKELGATVEWIAETESVIITQPNKNKTIYLKIGQASAIVNGMEIGLDCKPVIIEGRTFVPLRFISENFGAKVNWNSKTKTVSITYKIPVSEEPPILLPPWELQTTGSAITVID